MKLFLYELNRGALYKLSYKSRVEKLLQLYPNWRDAEDEEMDNVKAYFVKYGNVVASDAELTVRATY
jgi:hypothetical protein